jgi:hypothetical protein
MEQVDLRQYRDQKLKNNKLFQFTNKLMPFYEKYGSYYFFSMTCFNVITLQIYQMYYTIWLNVIFLTFGALFLICVMINYIVFFKNLEDIMTFCYELCIFSLMSDDDLSIQINNDLDKNNSYTLVTNKIYLRTESDLKDFIKKKIQCWEKEEYKETVRAKYVVGILEKQTALEPLFVLFFGNDGWHPFKIFGAKKYLFLWDILWLILTLLEITFVVVPNWLLYMTATRNTFMLPFIGIIVSCVFLFFVIAFKRMIFSHFQRYKNLLYFNLKRFN